MVRALRVHFRGREFDPWPGNKIPHGAAKTKQKLGTEHDWGGMQRNIKVKNGCIRVLELQWCVFIFTC